MPPLPKSRISELLIGSGVPGEFWDEVWRMGAPLVEPGGAGFSLVTFLWRDDGSARSVAVIQDWGADGIREHFMTLLPGSDVWFLTRRMRSDTRTTYQLSPSSSPDPKDPAPYRPDPLNPKIVTAKLSEDGDDILFSLLELPDAPTLPWRDASSIKTGAVEFHTPFADRRRLWVYLPPGPVTRPLPVLVAFDGRLYKDTLRLPEMLDYLIGTGDIPPTAALMLDSPDRSELICRPHFADYLAHQVIPWLRAAYPVAHDPLQTVAMGSSYGGLAAAFCAFRHPDVYGTVLSQSGWFRWRSEGDPEFHWLARQYAAALKLPVRFWLQVGNLETARMLDGGPTQLAANQYLRDTLLAKGYFVSYQEYSGGHDSVGMEAPLAKGLIEILNSL